MIKQLSLLLLTGCMTNNSLGAATMAQDNVTGLSRVSVGMTEGEVSKIMPHLHRKKTIEHEGDTYQVWFYVTAPSTLSQSRLLRQNLTPLTFENGILKGWGYEYYEHTLRKIEVKRPALEKPAPPEPREDRSLQRVLQGLEKKPSPSDIETPADTHEDKPLQKALEHLEKRPGNTSMSKKPRKSDQKKNSDQSESQDKETEGKALDDEGRRMREEENDQNFNFW